MCQVGSAELQRKRKAGGAQGGAVGAIEARVAYEGWGLEQN